MPDTGDQTSWYLNNDYNPDVKPLIAMFTTTNDITTTFRDYLNSSSPFYHDRSKAMNLIMDSAQSLVNQLAGLIPSNTSATAPDFLILPILPVDLTPSMKEVAKNAQVAMTIAQALTMQYNSILMEGAKSIARRLGSRGNVFTYDVPA